MKVSRQVCFIVSVVVLMGTVTYAQSERSLVREGNRSYKEQKFTDAEVSYRKALEKNKELHEGLFNLGDALYRQERFDEATEQYHHVAGKNIDPLTRAQAFHNLGNALLKSQKIPESISAYKEALKLNPRDLDTKYNLAYAQALLKQQHKQQQRSSDKQKQDQQKQQQKKQDKQQQDQQAQQNRTQEQQKEQKQAEQRRQISQEDAERILEALKNEERDVQKKLHKKVPARVKVEKDW